MKNAYDTPQTTMNLKPLTSGNKKVLGKLAFRLDIVGGVLFNKKCQTETTTRKGSHHNVHHHHPQGRSTEHERCRVHRVG